jgi:hypothetical protein
MVSFRVFLVVLGVFLLVLGVFDVHFGDISWFQSGF